MLYRSWEDKPMGAVSAFMKGISHFQPPTVLLRSLLVLYCAILVDFKPSRSSRCCYIWRQMVVESSYGNLPLNEDQHGVEMKRFRVRSFTRRRESYEPSLTVFSPVCWFRWVVAAGWELFQASSVPVFTLPVSRMISGSDQRVCLMERRSEEMIYMLYERKTRGYSFKVYISA